MQLFISLKHRFFAFLWSGQSISRVGDSVYRLALSWWVLEKTGSATIMGTVLILAFTPMLIFLLIGGVAVDRFSRTKLMLASDLLRGVVVLLVTILAYTNQLEIWHIYVATVVFGFVESFFQPAYVALIPDILPANSLPSANSLTSVSGQLAGVIGPAIGAIIVSMGGTSLAFLLDGLSFLISAIFLLPLVFNVRETHLTTLKKNNIFQDFHEGLKIVLAIPWLWISILIFAFSNITLSGPFTIALPFFVKNVLLQDVHVLGWVYSASSLGAFLGSIYLGRMAKIRHRGLIAYGSFLVSGLTYLLLGVFTTSIAAMAFMFAGGLAISLFSMIWTNTLQEMVPNKMLGRVSSIDMLGSFALLPIGFGIVGWITDLIGPANVFIIGGAISMLLALLGLTQSSIRKLD
jgi:MFS family permease